MDFYDFVWKFYGDLKSVKKKQQPNKFDETIKSSSRQNDT